MKTTLLQTSKAKVMIVDLPIGADRPKLFNDKAPYLSYFEMSETSRFYLPIGSWQILGFLPDITDKQKGSVCELHSITRINAHGWKDYVKSKDKDNFYTCWNASDSFSSLLESGGVTEYTNLLILISTL